jgi:chromosome segregation ATPase
MRLAALVLLACFVGGAAVPLLGEIDLMALKKQEEERRKKLAKSKIVVTDTNVNSISTGGKRYGFVQMESEDSPADETGKPASKEPAKADDQTKKPEYWQKQQANLQQKIASLKIEIEAAQLQLNGLWSDFYIKNIPAEQEAIRRQIADKTGEMEEKKTLLDESQAQLADLLEKARKAGVPPGWLR